MHRTINGAACLHYCQKCIAHWSTCRHYCLANESGNNQRTDNFKVHLILFCIRAPKWDLAYVSLSLVQCRPLHIRTAFMRKNALTHISDSKFVKHSPPISLHKHTHSNTRRYMTRSRESIGRIMHCTFCVPFVAYSVCTLCIYAVCICVHVWCVSIVCSMLIYAWSRYHPFFVNNFALFFFAYTTTYQKMRLPEFLFVSPCQLAWTLSRVFFFGSVPV